MGQDDLFSALFGGGLFGGGMGGRSRERKGKDVVHQLKVSLEDLYKGKTSKLALQKTVICTGCNGVGGKKGFIFIYLFNLLIDFLLIDLIDLFYFIILFYFILSYFILKIYN